MPNQVVAPEVALQDFERMCKARRLKTADETWTKEEKDVFEYIRDILCEAIVEGRLSVDSNDDPILKPTAPFTGEGLPESIKFKKAGGSTVLAMDGKQGGAKQFAAYADMAGINAGTFSKLGYHDVDLLAKLYTLFFAPR